ncbi:MAG: hypothetical protein ACR2PX_20355, partial [Endozoicomonas sp.]|uniref:hypothetical protein n=1 Tax=Endozoicomonas sp. TaxID=1892382 RepID=UPI003D9B48D2
NRAEIPPNYLNCIDLLRLFYPSLVNSKKSKPYSVGFMHSGGEKPLSNQEITDSGNSLISPFKPKFLQYD